MTDFESAPSFQAAMEQINALAAAATAASAVTATVERDLVTLTMSASLQVVDLTYASAAFGGGGAERLAEATTAAVAEAMVAVRAAQVESLKSMPSLAAVLDASTTAAVELPPAVAQQAKAAAEQLQDQEFTAVDGDNRVEVTLRGTGEITHLWLTATASRESAEEWLAPTVLRTLNDALAQMLRAQEAMIPGGETSGVEAQVDEVVEAFETRLAGLNSRLDEVVRKLDLG